MTAKHPRQIIREAVVALLKGHTDAGDRVFKSRVRPLTSRLLPAIGVYTTKQTSDTEETSPRKYSHTVKVHVQGVFEIDENLDDAMDALSLQVEKLLQADPTWGGVADDSALIETSMYFVNDGRVDSGCLELEFEADFETMPGLVSEPSLDDFATGGVTYARPTQTDPGFEDEMHLPTQAN